MPHHSERDPLQHFANAPYPLVNAHAQFTLVRRAAHH